MKKAVLAFIAAASIVGSTPYVFSQDNEPKSAADATRFPAKTPEERAERYLKWCLAPRIKDQSENLSETERTDLLEKSKVWSEQLRNAIIDFENVKVTPENVIEEIRHGENSDSFSAQLVEYFQDRLRYYGYKNDVFDDERLAKAYLDMAKLHDTLRNGGVSRRSVDSDRSEKGLFDTIQSLQMRIYSRLPSGKLNDVQLKQMKKTGYGVPMLLN
jgi:hypothetical protein